MAKLRHRKRFRHHKFCFPNFAEEFSSGLDSHKLLKELLELRLSASMARPETGDTSLHQHVSILHLGISSDLITHLKQT